MRTAFLLPFLVPQLLASSSAFAWGERGHDTVARVASRIIASDKDPEVAAYGRFLISKENMLAHLANVPDIVWRRPELKLDDVNPPSHYVDLEYIITPGKLGTAEALPQTFAEYRRRVEANCQKKDAQCAPGNTAAERLEKAGHVPFRIQNLSESIKAQLSEVRKLEGDAKTAKLSEALLYSGILAHFVGDIANPHHTTSDYDGWHTGQGGLHSYFETEMVDAQDLSLEKEVFIEAIRHNPASILAKANEEAPLPMAWELIRNSHSLTSKLAAVDEENSLLKKSEIESKNKGQSKPKSGKRAKAERRPPAAAAGAYRDFVVLRLAMGADSLARFWKAAYVGAQKPDVSFYKSYDYPVKPDFIPLGYDVK